MERDDESRARTRRKVCALFDLCRDEGGPRGLRDAALISVLFGANVPRAAALTLPLEAYRPSTGVLAWRPPAGPDGSATPRGSRQAGQVRMRRRATSGARSVLADWLAVRGGGEGPLLCRVVDGRIPSALQPLTSDDVSTALKTRAREARVRGCSTGAFRRLYDSPWWEEMPPVGPSG